LNKAADDPRLAALASVLDAQKGRYEQLRHASTFGAYRDAKGDRADEETLTEPVLVQILEKVLGFPGDEYVPQLGRSGLKPDIYRGKTDYLYYFLWLAVEKLAPGGRLCVITPAGWMNAGAADFLREKLTSELQLDEIFLFGSYRLFAADQGPAATPLVESAILVATKAAAPDGHTIRVVALEDESAWENRQALLDELAKREPAASRVAQRASMSMTFHRASCDRNTPGR
jgi:hypothetical protein